MPLTSRQLLFPLATCAQAASKKMLIVTVRLSLAKSLRCHDSLLRHLRIHFLSFRGETWYFASEPSGWTMMVLRILDDVCGDWSRASHFFLFLAEHHPLIQYPLTLLLSTSLALSPLSSTTPLLCSLHHLSLHTCTHTPRWSRSHGRTVFVDACVFWGEKTLQPLLWLHPYLFSPIEGLFPPWQ